MPQGVPAPGRGGRHISCHIYTGFAARQWARRAPKPLILSLLKDERPSARVSRVPKEWGWRWGLSAHLADRHRLKQRKAEQVAVLLLNAMMECARSMAERRTINQNGGQNDAPQIRPDPLKFVNPDKPSNRRYNRQRTIKNQIRNFL